MIRNLTRLALVCLLVVVAGPAWADTIQLKQSNGTITPLGGDGSAANVTIKSLFPGEDTANNALAVEGAAVRSTTVMSAVTTNTTTTAVALPIGVKTLYGQVVCSSGACVQTQAIYGDIDNDAANGILLCTLTLSGTTRAQDACAPMSANFSYYYVITKATSGTAAAGAIYAKY
jgi:hypothetical protein